MASQTPKPTPSKSKSDREILELRIELELNKAKQDLQLANQAELSRIAQERHEPKFRKLLSYSGIAIAVLIATNLFAWFGIKDRIAKEAGRLIDQKLVDPQLTNTLHEALTQKAVPFISAQVHLASPRLLIQVL